jgi:hypothetical protein
VPVVHDVAPTWQLLVGVQGFPAVHEVHPPLSQTMLVPHDVPLVTLVS